MSTKLIVNDGEVRVNSGAWKGAVFRKNAWGDNWENTFVSLMDISNAACGLKFVEARVGKAYERAPYLKKRIREIRVGPDNVRVDCVPLSCLPQLLNNLDGADAPAFRDEIGKELMAILGAREEDIASLRTSDSMLNVEPGEQVFFDVRRSATGNKIVVNNVAAGVTDTREVSVYDVMRGITNAPHEYVVRLFSKMCKDDKSLKAVCSKHDFYRWPEPVASADGIAKILDRMPGSLARVFCESGACDTLRELLGGEPVPAVIAPAEVDNACLGRNMVAALTGGDGKLISEIRRSDGFVNATKLCSSAGKRWHDFIRLQTATDFIAALKNTLRVCTDLVESTEGRYGGTWVHPRIAIKLAAWCSTDFEIQVTDIILRYYSGTLATERPSVLNGSWQPEPESDFEQKMAQQMWFEEAQLRFDTKIEQLDDILQSQGRMLLGQHARMPVDDARDVAIAKLEAKVYTYWERMKAMERKLLM